MSSPDPDPVRNLYKPGPISRLRERWRAFRADPRGAAREAPARAGAGLRGELRRDREAFAGVLRSFG
ncbi:MAG: hypothetical protein AB1941_27665, partial [Gemmatimonadota bacterium]